MPRSGDARPSSPPLIAPERSAHASIEGYLYQTWIGVERWLELGEDEILRCEGDEDLDVLLLDGGGQSIQVKALTGGVSVRSEAVLGTLRRFAISFHRLHDSGSGRRFVFVTTAPRARQRRDGELDVDVLEVWQSVRGPDADPESRARVVAALGKLLPRVQEVDEGRDAGLGEALAWLDAEPDRWGEFLSAVDLRFEEDDRTKVERRVESGLHHRWTDRDLPPELPRLLLAELLGASAAPDVADRCRTRSDLDRLVDEAERRVTTWRRTPRARHLTAVLDDLDALREVLHDRRLDLPSDPRPGQVLSAAFEVVPFSEEGREELLDDLAAWCEVEDRAGVWLLHGEGGLGKTRLLLEWCRRLAAQGWVTGFLQTLRREDLLDRLLQGQAPRLVVIDYAESKPEATRYLVTRLAERGTDAKLRIVLLSRRPAGWWDELVGLGDAEAVLLAKRLPTEVPPLPDGGDTRHSAFRAAYDAFASLRSGTAPPPPEPDLADPVFRRPLYLHAAALVALDGRMVTSGEEAIAAVLDRERRYWTQLVEGTVHEVLLQRELVSAITRAVTVVTLWGGASRGRAAELLGRLLANGPQAKRDLARDLLLRLYATPAESGPALGPLEPDVLGERLVGEEIAADRPEALDLAVELGDGPAREQVLTVLGRLAQRRPAVGEALLQLAYARRLEALAEPALEVAVRTGDPVGELLAEPMATASPEVALRVMDLCDEERLRLSVPLSGSRPRRHAAGFAGSRCDRRERSNAK